MQCASAEGCNRRAVDGMSYCSEDHYDDLVAERKAKHGYRMRQPGEKVAVHVPVVKQRNKTEQSRAIISDERLTKLRRLGMSYAQIGKDNGVEWPVIADRCAKLGLGRPPKAPAKKEEMADPYKVEVERAQAAESDRLCNLQAVGEGDTQELAQIWTKVFSPSAIEGARLYSVLAGLKRDRDTLDAVIRVLELRNG